MKRDRRQKLEDARRDDWIPRRRTLDGFADEVDQEGGLDVSRLPSLTELIVRTHNSVYRLVVLEPAETKVLIQGGHFFNAPTRRCLHGSTYGGSIIKRSWIGVGMRMEIGWDNGNVVTSPVRAVYALEDSTLAGPF